MAQATYFGIFSEATLTRRQIMLNVLYFTPYGYPLEGPKPLTSDTLRSSNRNVEKYPMMSRTQPASISSHRSFKLSTDNGISLEMLVRRCFVRTAAARTGCEISPPSLFQWQLTRHHVTITATQLRPVEISGHSCG
ncbi:predicted protein [Histoplasma capsulatum var. duboisii H88]|uniref:Predicted protein n=1 Tax=Ajellomyces capsulatus (strain H88) TaxID=544711 RepID=F0UEY9_AJEC8|nr:predicted protein [Histoplasma capsulatum var. duboisii H88]